MSEADTTTNPRWEAARIVHGPGLKYWQFTSFISRAMRFAWEHDMGVRRLDWLSKYYSEPQLVVIDHDKFTEACWKYAKSQHLPGVVAQ